MTPAQFIYLGMLGVVTFGLLVYIAARITESHRWLRELRTDMDKVVIALSKIQKR